MAFWVFSFLLTSLLLALTCAVSTLHRLFCSILLYYCVIIRFYLLFQLLLRPTSIIIVIKPSSVSNRALTNIYSCSKEEVLKRHYISVRRRQNHLTEEKQVELAREISTLRSKLERAERTRASGYTRRVRDTSSDEMVPSRLKITIGSKRERQRISAESDVSFDSDDDSSASDHFHANASDDDQSYQSSSHLKKHVKKRKLGSNHSVGSRMLRLRTKRTRSPSPDFSNEDEESESSSSDDATPRLRSYKLPSNQKHKHRARAASPRVIIEKKSYGTDYGVTRRSNRTTRTRANMTEIGIEDIERSDSETSIQLNPKATGAREDFKSLPRHNFFRSRHLEQCETCRNKSNISSPLIYCQGCSLAYHKDCIGPRSGRLHLATKIGEDDFVLQCRRCVNVPRQKDLAKTDRKGIAPQLSRCQDCHEDGAACSPFRGKKTMLQEQREREANNNEDPIVPVDSSLINNARNVMFRCIECFRAFHFHHLPSRAESMDIEGQSDEELAQQRFVEYSRGDAAWRCEECVDAPAKVGGIIAWRPIDLESYQPGVRAAEMDEDEKEYLIKWNGLSYFHAEWKPGSWIWGVTNTKMRAAFFNKEDGPKMRMEEAIPDDFLSIDIVLDIHYANGIDYKTEEIDRARIREVDSALVKYKGLGYEDVVWEKVPSPEDEDRWTDFVAAYNDWVLRRYISLPNSKRLQIRLEQARSRLFEEKTEQPKNVVGGEMMQYQIRGLNWLYRQWYDRRCGILADEMGLGKTIQVIAFIAMMVLDFHCYPFLIVVPNSTCPNWRREIKKWVPQLHVVTYFGSAKAREMAERYEMFPEQPMDLRCHVVVTSYEAAIDDSCQRVFKKLVSRWQGVFVDEGHRLKNDKSLLYSKLRGLNIPYRILLTGSPNLSSPYH